MTMDMINNEQNKLTQKIRKLDCHTKSRNPNI